jgi:hypothetical protein
MEKKEGGRRKEADWSVLESRGSDGLPGASVAEVGR